MIDIDDEEVIELIMKFAAIRGVDPDTAIREAVQAALDREDETKVAKDIGLKL